MRALNHSIDRATAARHEMIGDTAVKSAPYLGLSNWKP